MIVMLQEGEAKTKGRGSAALVASLSFCPKTGLRLLAADTCLQEPLRKISEKNWSSKQPY